MLPFVWVGPARAAETVAVATAQPVEPREIALPSSPPLSIDDTETVEKGHCEVNFTVGLAGKPGSWEAEAPLVDANLGLTDNIHINAEMPYVFGAEDGETSGGLGRGAFAVKVRVLHRERVQLTFHPAVELPPIGGVSYEQRGPATFTLPVVLDVGLDARGDGLGFQLSRAVSTDGSEDAWGAALGLAAPIGDSGKLLLDYAQEAAPDLALGEGWVELGYVAGDLFGSEHLTLLSSVGRSTQGNSEALLGVQVAL